MDVGGSLRRKKAKSHRKWMSAFSQKVQPEASRGADQGPYFTARDGYLFGSAQLDFITAWTGGIVCHSSHFQMQCLIVAVLFCFCQSVSSVLEAGFLFICLFIGHQTIACHILTCQRELCITQRPWTLNLIWNCRGLGLFSLGWGCALLVGKEYMWMELNIPKVDRDKDHWFSHGHPFFLSFSIIKLQIHFEDLFTQLKDCISQVLL